MLCFIGQDDTNIGLEAFWNATWVGCIVDRVVLDAPALLQQGPVAGSQSKIGDTLDDGAPGGGAVSNGGDVDPWVPGLQGTYAGDLGAVAEDPGLQTTLTSCTQGALR